MRLRPVCSQFRGLHLNVSSVIIVTWFAVVGDAGYGHGEDELAVGALDRTARRADAARSDARQATGLAAGRVPTRAARDEEEARAEAPALGWGRSFGGRDRVERGLACHGGRETSAHDADVWAAASGEAPADLHPDFAGLTSRRHPLSPREHLPRLGLNLFGRALGLKRELGGSSIKVGGLFADPQPLVGRIVVAIAAPHGATTPRDFVNSPPPAKLERGRWAQIRCVRS
jgi:hypothetical protein